METNLEIRANLLHLVHHLHLEIEYLWHEAPKGFMSLKSIRTHK